MTRIRHALTGFDYEVENADRVCVADGERRGRFDRLGNWLEGEIIQCDPQICIWLTGLFVVQARQGVHEPSAATCKGVGK